MVRCDSDERNGDNVNTTQHGIVPVRQSLQRIVSNSTIKEQIFSLNTQQRNAFDIICDWAHKKVISMNSDVYVAPQPLCLFIIGGADVGKSNLVNSIRLFLGKKLY